MIEKEERARVRAAAAEAAIARMAAAQHNPVITENIKISATPKYKVIHDDTDGDYTRNRVYYDERAEAARADAARAATIRSGVETATTTTEGGTTFATTVQMMKRRPRRIPNMPKQRFTCCQRFCICLFISYILSGVFVSLLFNLTLQAIIIKGTYMISRAKPTIFPIETFSDDEIVDTIASFQRNLERIVSTKRNLNYAATTKMTDEWVIPARAFNGIIFQSADFRGYAHVTMKDHELIVQTSYPIDSPIPWSTNRFFVSTLTIRNTKRADPPSAIRNETGAIAIRTADSAQALLNTVGHDIWNTVSLDLGTPSSTKVGAEPFLVIELQPRQMIIQKNLIWYVNVKSVKLWGKDPPTWVTGLYFLIAFFISLDREVSALSKYLWDLAFMIESIHVEPDQMIIRTHSNVNGSNSMTTEKKIMMLLDGGDTTTIQPAKEL